MVFWRFWIVLFLMLPLVLLGVILSATARLLLLLIPWDFEQWIHEKVSLPYLKTVPAMLLPDGWDQPPPGRQYVENETFYQGEWLRAEAVVEKLEERTLEMERLTRANEVRLKELQALYDEMTELTVKDLEVIRYGDELARSVLVDELIVHGKVRGL